MLKKLFFLIPLSFNLYAQTSDTLVLNGETILLSSPISNLVTSYGGGLSANSGISTSIYNQTRNEWSGMSSLQLESWAPSGSFNFIRRNSAYLSAGSDATWPVDSNYLFMMNIVNMDGSETNYLNMGSAGNIAIDSGNALSLNSSNHLDIQSDLGVRLSAGSNSSVDILSTAGFYRDVYLNDGAQIFLDGVGSVGGAISSNSALIATNASRIANNSSQIANNSSRIDLANQQAAWTNRRIDALESAKDSGLASVIAMSNVGYSNGGSYLSFGFGKYRGDLSSAIGYSYANDSIAFKFTVSEDGAKGFGFSLKLN